MKHYKARWWHKSGFWTTGTFIEESAEAVKRIIRESGGTDIDVVEEK